MKLLKMLPQLVHLNLSGTKCNDQVMSIVGHHCPNLQRLDINNCHLVTDAGIFSLCMPLGGSVSKCTKFVHLEAMSPMVTIKGIKVLLSCCSRIEVLKSPHVVYSISELYNESVANGKFDETFKYELTSLMWHPYHHGTLVDHSGLIAWGLVCSMCPKMRDIELITDLIVGQDWLSHLNQLEHLQHLTITAIDDGRILGMVEFLQKCGHRLLSLNVTNPNIGLSDLGIYCPNLQTLSVHLEGTHTGHTFGNIPKPEKHMLVNLTELSVKLDDISNLQPSYIFNVLLHSKSLQRLDLNGVHFFTDDLIEDILQTNPLEHLERLELLNCNQITMDGVDALLGSCTQLSVLNLILCHEITRRDFDSIKRRARHFCWNLEVEWL